MPPHWTYYVRLCQMIHFSVISRPITSEPWDRIPSETWYYADANFSQLASFVLVGFSFLFTLAWNFHFPTPVERLLWRIASVCHTAFSLYGGVYYLIEVFSTRKERKREGPGPRDAEAQAKYQGKGVQRRGKMVLECMRSWRNTSLEQNPNMEIPLRILVPVTVKCALHRLCGGFIHFEDFLALRAQPAGVYLTVNRFMLLLVG
jgi:hypothetical protein